MAGKPRDENTFELDMPFSEALTRFIGTSPQEMRANVEKSKKKKPPGTKKKTRAAPGSKLKAKNVVSLKERKTSYRRRGLA